ncbi:hypothetical protein FRB90_000163 [Tulasnella sp. 427]|nr:hypothetical protein FRB90_000163 [Tulasnella sp. 427]
MCQWHEYFWTVTLAWITYCVVVDPLSSITQMIERRWRWIPLILCVTALALSWIQTLIAGVDYIGGFCYSHNHKKKIWNELSVFGPRCLVAIVISSYYLMIFWYIKRNRPIVPPVSIQLTPDPTSQTGATTSTRRGRRRLTTETVAEVLDASVPTPEPRGRPWPVGRLPTGSGESIPITDPEVLHNLDQIKVGERMIDKQVTRSIWSMDTEDIVEPTSTDIEQDPSGATTSDTAMSHETSGTVSSGAPLTRETTEARPTSVVSMVVNRLSASFLGWQTWNIGDPTPGTTTTSQQRRITMSPRTSQIPESGISASASGVSHSTALEELGTTDPNFGGPRRRQRTAPGAELLNVPGPSRFGMSHSRSESYPSRTPSPSTVGGMTASQSGPAGSSTMTYPPISTRIPSASWNAATSYSGSQTLAPSDVSAALNINTDEEGLVYNDYTPARRLAQEISPVFLVFPLSYMLISAVGLARVIHTLGTDYPNPWFHIVSRWTLLLQAPIDAITLHYISRRLGRRLRAVVEEGIARNNPAV